MNRRTRRQKEIEWTDLPEEEKRKYNGFEGYCKGYKEMIF